MFSPDSRLMICNVDRDKIERFQILYPEFAGLSVEDIVDCCLEYFFVGSEVPSSGNLIYPTN